MKVHFVEAARKDLQDIARYIWEYDPKAAVRIVDGLIESSLALADMPYRYALVPRRESKGVRRRRYGKYLIFFRVARGFVEILRVLHGAMDTDSILENLE